MTLKVLNIGPGRNSRGGISSVIGQYEQMFKDTEFIFGWLETQYDRSSLHKIVSFVKAILRSYIIIPSYDIIHIHTASYVSFYRKSFFIFFGRLLNKKVLLHIHGGGFADFLKKSYKNPLKRFIIKNLLNASDMIVCLSKTKSGELKNYINKNKTVLLMNPCELVPVSMFKESSSLTIIFAGWIEPEKGVFDLVNAFSRLCSRYSGIRLIIAGKGKIESCIELASSLGISDKVIMTGWLEKRELFSYMEKSTVFCLPSYCEGVPMSILEAMSHGLPIVASSVGGIPDIIIDGVNGFLIHPGDIKQLACKLEELIENPDIRHHFSLNGIKMISDNCSTRVIKYKLIGIYKRLLS